MSGCCRRQVVFVRLCSKKTCKKNVIRLSKNLPCLKGVLIMANYYGTAGNDITTISGRYEEAYGYGGDDRLTSTGEGNTLNGGLVKKATS